MGGYAGILKVIYLGYKLSSVKEGGEERLHLNGSVVVCLVLKPIVTGNYPDPSPFLSKKAPMLIRKGNNLLQYQRGIIDKQTHLTMPFSSDVPQLDVGTCSKSVKWLLHINILPTTKMPLPSLLFFRTIPSKAKH